MPSKESPIEGLIRPDEIEWINALFYGVPGVGKTTLCGSAVDHPKTRPALLIDCEGGTVTLRGKDIDVKPARSMDDIVQIHNDLRTNNDGYYKTVIIDSLSELADLDMRTVMADMVKRSKEQGKDRDPDVADRREWGIVRTHMRKIVRAYRDLPMNTLFTALLNIDKDDVTGKTTFYPAMSGKLKGEIPGFVDIVGHMRVVMEGEEVVRKIQFQGTDKVTAKDRTASLGAFMNNPTIPIMWDLLHPNTKK
jgi:phage nucleotide-binding protein